MTRGEEKKTTTKEPTEWAPKERGSKGERFASQIGLPNVCTDRGSWSRTGGRGQHT